jgi:hypothetical protein
VSGCLATIFTCAGISVSSAIWRMPERVAKGTSKQIPTTQIPMMIVSLTKYANFLRRGRASEDGLPGFILATAKKAPRTLCRQRAATGHTLPLKKGHNKKESTHSLVWFALFACLSDAKFRELARRRGLALLSGHPPM